MSDAKSVRTYELGVFFQGGKEKRASRERRRPLFLSCHHVLYFCCDNSCCQQREGTRSIEIALEQIQGRTARERHRAKRKTGKPGKGIISTGHVYFFISPSPQPKKKNEREHSLLRSSTIVW